MIVCELFGMSSRAPVNITFSLTEFSQHGGATGPHKDGWGVAYFEEEDVRLIRDSDAAANSVYIKFLESLGLSSNIVISHIRKATQGDPKLKNTQPFARELGGQMHVFAHNGDLKRVREQCDITAGSFRPIGETDSEYAFCALLQRMQPLWMNSAPAIANRLMVVKEFAAQIRELGPANFIYSDGDVVFAHGHRRTQADLSIRPPGLHYLCRNCAEETGPFKTKGLSIHLSDQQQEVVVIASVPLTGEAWKPLSEGEIIVMHAGRILEDADAENRQSRPSNQSVEVYR